MISIIYPFFSEGSRIFLCVSCVAVSRLYADYLSVFVCVCVIRVIECDALYPQTPYRGACFFCVILCMCNCFACAYSLAYIFGSRLRASRVNPQFAPYIQYVKIYRLGYSRKYS